MWESGSRLWGSRLTIIVTEHFHPYDAWQHRTCPRSGRGEWVPRLVAPLYGSGFIGPVVQFLSTWLQVTTQVSDLDTVGGVPQLRGTDKSKSLLLANLQIFSCSGSLRCTAHTIYQYLKDVTTKISMFLLQLPIIHMN
jgi:hypothetical protein